MIKNSAKRKGMILISLLLLLIVLTGVYFILIVDTKEKEEPIIASQLDFESIVELTYRHDNMNVDLIKKGDLWVLGSDENCPLNQEKIKSMIYSAATVNAERIVANSADDYKRFGLDNPDITVWISDSNGDIVTYYLSSYKKDSSGYFFTASGTEKVYFIKSTLFGWFSSDLPELIELDKFPLTNDKDVTGFTISSMDSALEAVYIKDTSNITYLKDTHWFLKNGDGGFWATDTDKTKNLLHNILTLSPDSCAYYDASKEELALSGMNEPRWTVYINSDKPYTIYIGSKDKDELNYYVMHSESSMVYTVKSVAIDEILGTASADLLPEQICRIDLKEVSQLKVFFNGNTYDMDINWNTDGVNCEVNGKKANQESFLAFYDSIVKLNNDGLTDEYSYTNSSEPYTSIIFKIENSSDLTLRIYPYDLNFYRVEFDGNKNLLAGEKGVRDIMEKLNKLMR